MRWKDSPRTPSKHDRGDGPTSTLSLDSISGDRTRDLPLPIPSTTSLYSSLQFLITHIRAGNITVDLGRIPVGFYVAVEAAGIKQRTRNKPILMCDRDLEWDDEIFLPSEPSSNVCLRVCASFEFFPTLGNGQTLRTFVLSVGELLKRNEITSSIEFCPQEGEPAPCLLLCITVERRSCTLDMLTHVACQPNDASDSVTPSSLSQITDEGHQHLLYYQKHKKPDDLMHSIACFERALDACLPTHPCLAVALFNLATAQFISCQDDIASPGFDVPISLYRDALGLRPIYHPDRPANLLHLARAIISQFQKCGDESYAKEARILIAQVQSVCSEDSYEYQFADGMLPECDPDKVTNSSSAIPSTSTAIVNVHTPDSLTQMHAMLNDLTSALMGRPERHGYVKGFNESIAVTEKTAKDHPFRSTTQASLGLSFFQRYNRRGQIVDADESLSMEEETIQHVPDHDPNKHIFLSCFALSFLARFQRLKDLADLDKATSMIEDALLLTPEDHPKRPLYLTILSGTLTTRFSQLGRMTDLDQSILILEEVAESLLDNDLLKTQVLTSLSGALQLRSTFLKGAADAEKSISTAEKSASIRSPMSLASISISSFTRFKKTRNVADLDKSISFMEKALDLSPEGHRFREIFLMGAGILSMCRFIFLDSVPALRSALSYLSCSARCRTSGQPSEQLQACKLWIQCATFLRRVSHSEADQAQLEAYECTIGLFPQFAWLGLPLKDRYAQLREAASITRRAVTLALSLGHTTKAVEWLEQGRCVVWGQSLQLHTLLDKLRRTYPDLADRFEALSSAVQHSSNTHDAFMPNLGGQRGQEESLEQQARQRRKLVDERENLLEKIQQLPGLEGCISPRAFSQLRGSARLGPIILLHVRPGQGDALIVVADLDEPLHVPLPGINEQHAEYLRTSLQQLLSEDGRLVCHDGPLRAARVVRQTGVCFNYILSELWTKIVRPVLHALALSIPGELTRVFWCPTGPLSFLPIHAAGNYDVPGAGNKASDFIISSYIPMLSLLSPPPSCEPTSPSSIRLLAVPQPHTDGQMQLFGAPVEVDHIKQRIDELSSSHIQFRASDGEVESVIGGMEQSDWVHFACHGVQDASSPTDSGLCLADQRRLRLSDIIRLSRPRVGLAFLSACQTATGAVELSDEAVHLSAGMLFAGYSGVIGTMWSIRDSVAPQLAKDVYEQLFRDGRAPDSAEAALALHDAVERLRQSGVPFMAWVPFIHMGV